MLLAVSRGRLNSRDAHISLPHFLPWRKYFVPQYTDSATKAMASSLRGISAPYLCIAVIVQGEASLSATFGATFRADLIFLLVIVPARFSSPIHDRWSHSSMCPLTAPSMHDYIRVGNSMVSGGLNSVFKFGSVQWEGFRTICSYPAPDLRRSWYGREIFAAILEAIILACVPPGDAFANLGQKLSSVD